MSWSAFLLRDRTSEGVFGPIPVAPVFTPSYILIDHPVPGSINADP
jgi:hypothetical protein